jgi:hypothetical protein
MGAGMLDSNPMAEIALHGAGYRMTGPDLRHPDFPGA